MIKRFVVICICTTLVAMSGCKEQKISVPVPKKEQPPAYMPFYEGLDPETQVKNVIRRYNELLAYGYKNLDMTPLHEVATPELAEKAYFHMAAIGEGKLYMSTALKKIDFLTIEFNGDSGAAAETREVWDYAHIEMETGRKYAEEKDFIYTMGYRLSRKDGGWIIEDVTAITAESTNTAIPLPDDKPAGFGREEAGEGGAD